MVDAIDAYYATSNANVHRGVHTLGNEATELFENARARVATFIDAPPEGLVFVRNTTEVINLVAYSYATELLQPGDRIVVTVMEHHSNLVPWQLAARAPGVAARRRSMSTRGWTPRPEHARRARLVEPTRLVGDRHQSNVLGTVNDIRTITEPRACGGSLVCSMPRQSVPHMAFSARDLDCDFIAFSGHKMCGPMGIGVLWARPELLERMPPFLGGGSMISRVTLESSTWNTGAAEVEAGTPTWPARSGSSAACDYIACVGRDRDPRARDRR